MFGEKLIIKQYPYLGYSKNLIEYFGIIGYSEDFIPELISSIKNTSETKSSLSNPNQHPPTIISSIMSKNDYGIIDNELIINQLYPDNPKIILVENNESEPEKSNVIYSFCFDSLDGKKKVFYTCFGYKFYEIFKYGEDKYYIPKAFCIISQYAFFNAFYIICKNLYDILSLKNYIIPKEIIIYNITNYIPSPLNSNLELFLFPHRNEEYKIEINQLNGYPNLDFDLFEIFNILPLNLIIEVYVLAFLEINLLFFSSNLEILNTIMYIIYMFNYPCNDCTYFWHIVSVGKNNLDETNKFVGKVMSSLLGVNCTYDQSIDTSAFSNYCYIIDIDNKKIIFKESFDLSKEEKEDSKKLNNLINYIDNILKEKTIDSYMLKKPLHKLKNRIINFLEEKIIGFSTFPKRNFVNFFKEEKSNKNNNINLKILEFFYDCTLSLLSNFYNDNQLTSSFDKIVKEENNGTEFLLRNQKNLEEEEKYFCELFRGCVKYKVYFENFLSEFDVIDVFKIPFLFSRIFIELKLKDDKEISCENMNYFSIISQLYQLNNNQNIVKRIYFNNFNQYYLENMDKYFKRFFQNEILRKNIEEETGKIDVPNEKRYNLIKLNKKILNRYIYLLQNFYENSEIENIFYELKKKENIDIFLFDRRIIFQIIKNKLIEKKYISSLNFLIYTLIYVIALTITLHPFNRMISYLGQVQETLKLIKYFCPHYLYTLIKSIYKYYLINKETFKYPSMNLTHIKMYFYFLANFIRSQLILPNEEIMFILKSFFSDIIFKERKEINQLEKKSKLDDESNIINNNSIDEKEEFIDVNKSDSYLIFIKYCFNGKKMFRSKMIVERAMLDLEASNIIIKNGNKTNYPQILIKINNYIFTSKLFTPWKLFKDSENIFEELFDINNLDISFLDLDKLREIIVNLIIYGKELEYSKIPVNYLVNSLYLLRNLENKNPMDKTK